MEFQKKHFLKISREFFFSSNEYSLFYSMLRVISVVNFYEILQGEDRFKMEATFSDQTFSHHIRKFIHGEAERLPSICHLNNIINIQCTTSSSDLIWDHNDQTSLMASLDIWDLSLLRITPANTWRTWSRCLSKETCSRIWYNYLKILNKPIEVFFEEIM